MFETTYTWSEVEKKAYEIATNMIKDAVNWQLSANNIKKGDPRWYILEDLKHQVVYKNFVRKGIISHE